MNEDGTLTFSEADLLQHASDADGDDLTVMVDNYYGNDGIFTHNDDGTFTFAPNENFNGDLSINYAVTDGEAISEAQINITVEEVNDPPVVGSTAYSVNEDGEITISQEQLLANATDIEGDDLTASNLTVSGNANVVGNDDGSFTIVPDADFNGDIDISFDVTDGTDTVQATADLTVNPVNDLPQPQDQSFTIQEDGYLTFTDSDLLENAVDIDGDDLTVEDVTYTGTDGILTDNGDGTYSFAPNENFNGDVNFSFDVSDGTETVSANVAVEVTSVDDAPTVEATLLTPSTKMVKSRLAKNSFFRMRVISKAMNSQRPTLALMVMLQSQPMMMAHLLSRLMRIGMVISTSALILLMATTLFNPLQTLRSTQ